ncbi:response regulator [Rhabdobacter roseus]|nr:response regulator [Rhabdobacter roseus]
MKLQVLLVDDDPVMIVLHKALVTRAALSAEPLVCVNGAEALEVVCQQDDGATVFLILLDINMPVMNGWEFLAAIQEVPVQARIRVCVVTSSIDQSDREQAQTFPQVIGFLTKPLSRHALENLKQHDTLRAFFTDSPA